MLFVSEFRTQDSFVRTNWHSYGQVLYTAVSPSLLCPFPSSLRFRPGFRSIMLCLFHLQLSVLTLSSPAYMFTTSSHRRSWLSPITNSLSPLDFSLSQYLSSADSDCPSLSLSRSAVPIGSVSLLVHYSSFLSFPSTHIPHLLVPFGFVNREILGLYFRNPGARSALPSYIISEVV